MVLELRADLLIRHHGTLASGVGLHFVRRAALEEANIRRMLASVPPEGQVVWRQRLQTLTERLLLRAYDLDGTMAYALPESPEGALQEWPAGMLVPLAMPGRDVVEAIREGRLKGLDLAFVNTASYHALNGAGDASGGARTNGAFAFAANRERVAREERSALQRFATRRRPLADARDRRIQVIDLMGWFGGVGTGAFPSSFERLRDVAAELGLDVENQPLVLLPGTWPAKDPRNSLALAYACLKEYVAAQTGYYWRRRRRAGSDRPTTAREAAPPAFLVEDANNTPGASRTLPPERLASWAADLLRHLLFTPLGDHVRAKVGDFGLAAERLTAYGEPLAGRTFGLATIHLDRDRQGRYSCARLEQAVFNRCLQPADHETIRQNLRVFLESRRVVQGAGRSDLPQRLLEGSGEDAASLAERALAQVRRTLEGIEGLELLETAARLVADGVRAAGDREAELAQRRGQLVRDVLSDADRRVAEIIVEPSLGLAAAADWLRTACGVVENMIQAADGETPDFDARIEELRGALGEFDNYAAASRERGRLYRWFYSDQIGAAAARCRNLHEQSVRLEFQRAAHLHGIQALHALLEALRDRLSRAERRQAWAEECLSAAEERRKRAAGEDPAFACPVGLPLLSDEGDLADLHARLVPDEDQAVRQFFVRLATSDQDQPLAQRLDGIFESRATFARAVEAFAEETLERAIAGLHVVDELQRRYGVDSEMLKAVLRERDLEAYPRLRLKDSSELEHQPILVRLLGLDRSRGRAIELLVPEAVTAQSVPYTPVDTGDPERISFLQVYGGFPVSDWAGLVPARAAYVEASEGATFERYHVWPYLRFLPDPGRPLSPEEVAVFAFEAWALDRLAWDPLQGWKLLPGIDSEPEMRLGPGFEAMHGAEGYRRAIDVITQFWCRFQECGPVFVRDRLAVLEAIQRGATARTEVERRLAELITNGVKERIERQLEWVEINTLPQAQEWHGASLLASNGRAAGATS